MEAWFPTARDAPNVGLLFVESDSAEYWDSPGGRVASVLAYAKAKVTGDRPDVGESRHRPLGSQSLAQAGRHAGDGERVEQVAHAVREPLTLDRVQPQAQLHPGLPPSYGASTIAQVRSVCPRREV